MCGGVWGGGSDCKLEAGVGLHRETARSKHIGCPPPFLNNLFIFILCALVLDIAIKYSGALRCGWWEFVI